MQKTTMQKTKSSPKVIVSAGGDPWVGNLATPVNASALTLWYINNLPAYRTGLTPWRRGLEVGMAHGYWLLGPFLLLGPFRGTMIAGIVGLSSTIALVAIATLCLSFYAATEPAPPVSTLTVPTAPDAFTSPDGWNGFANGFLIGGIGGAVFAFGVLVVLSLLGLF
jgi:photosystem I subunit XI